MGFPRDHYPTKTTTEILAQFNAICDEEMTGKTMASVSSGDVSATSQIQTSLYGLKKRLWETLCAKDSETYTWPPDFLRQNVTTTQFRITQN